MRMKKKKKKKKKRRSRMRMKKNSIPAKSVSAESSAISDSSLTVPSHLQRLKHCIYLFPNKNICILNGNK
ncbi:unnamed protein product [Staurois parvus]|uniref:Ribosomal protein L41 n=1 Tax=Staurois parvus TaxID=386267 RepID=A0ABN9C2E9_9NEOB|nr:unnamed protein product [Staurois parvus]CAI9596459.1 unnamed protein product [Staurois parvus]